LDKHSIKVVLIDEDINSRETIGSFLIQEGYKILLMSNIRNSYPYVKRAKPNLILLSVTKPKIHSYAFVKTVKESEWGKEIPLIIIEEKEKPPGKETTPFKKIPPELILKKPLDLDELKAKLDKLVISECDTQPIDQQETIAIDTTAFLEKTSKAKATSVVPKEEESPSSETTKNGKTKKRSRRKLDFSGLKKIILVGSLALLFIVVFPLMYLKFKPFTWKITTDKPIEQVKLDKEKPRGGEPQVADYLKEFKEKMTALEKRGIENYLREEYAKLKIMIAELESDSKNTKTPKKELRERTTAIQKLLDSLSEQINIAKTQEKAKALDAIREAEEIITIINRSKLNISTENQIQEAKSSYLEAKALLQKGDTDYKKIHSLSTESIDKLMRMPEYNFFKLQDERKIKLREEADLYFNLKMYVFPKKTNALKAYKEILKIHPTNRHALKRIEEIKKIIKRKGDRFYEADNLPGAYIYYKEYLELVPDDKRVERRLKEIEAKRRKEVNFWELVSEIHPIIWFLLLGLAFAIYRYLPLILKDVKYVYLIIGLILLFLIIVLILS